MKPWPHKSFVAQEAFAKIAAMSAHGLSPAKAPATSHFSFARLRPYAFAAALVVLCFLLFLRRPYSVVSDIGYQAFSAWQYAHHEVAHFLSVELADPRDVSKNIECPLYAWSPSWTLLFFVLFKLGLSAGTAGRALGFFLSLIGAAGWVWMSSAVGLKGGWRTAGIVLSALYCLRSHSDTLLGAGDLIVYAAAPWLLGAALNVAARIRATGRNALRDSALVCFAAGAVYWLKYSGVFLGIAVFFFLALQHLRAPKRTRMLPTLALLAVNGAAFLLPILGAKLYNFERSGADAVEAAVKFNYSPPRTLKRLGLMVYEAAYTSSAALFSSGPGADWFTRRINPAHDAGSEDLAGFAFRFPALLLLPVLLFVLWRYRPVYEFDLALMLIAVPFAGFPVVSFVAGDKFTFAMGRCCEPFWICLELLALLGLSQGGKGGAPSLRVAHRALAALTAIECVLFLFTPALSAHEIERILAGPRYRAGASNLWVTDLSRFGSLDIDAKVKTMLRGPQDVVVPAVYSNRSFGMDLWLEYAAWRQLPLTIFSTPLWKTHGADGASYYASTPFSSSRPVRVVLVASDTFNDPAFPANVERIKGRFSQAHGWTRGPLDADNRVQIWAADLY